MKHNGENLVGIADIVSIRRIKPEELPREPTFDEVKKVQQLYCRFRTKCLTITIKNNWESFTCNNCRAFIPLDVDEIQHDTDAILALLSVVRTSSGRR